MSAIPHSQMVFKDLDRIASELFDIDSFIPSMYIEFRDNLIPYIQVDIQPYPGWEKRRKQLEEMYPDITVKPITYYDHPNISFFLK